MSELKNDAHAAKILPPLIDKVRNEKEELRKKIEVLQKIILAHRDIIQVLLKLNYRIKKICYNQKIQNYSL